MDNEFLQHLEEKLSKANLDESLPIFKVTIEEHYTQTFEIEAADIGEAMGIAEDKHRTGELTVDVDTYPTTQLMMAENESGEESTEWVEF